MGDRPNLGFREFLTDLKGVIVSPAQRFAVIQERGAIWGSLLLAGLSFYFIFDWTGGVYFDRAPFPGYPFLLPLVLALATVFIRVILIHTIAGLLQGKKDRSESRGTCRKLLTVLGYATLPSLLAYAFATLLFLLIPNTLAALLRDNRPGATTLLITVGATLFIWDLILAVLALRTVYPLSDAKLMFAFFVGSPLATALLGPLFSVASVPVRVDYVYLQPLLSQKMVRLFFEDPLGQIFDNPADQITGKSRVMVKSDLLAYRFKSPRIFDLVIYSTKQEATDQANDNRIWFRRPPWADKVQAVGRIVGVPGDEVEVTDGNLKIKGQLWAEPYLAPEFRARGSFAARRLGESQYAIFPENRQLLRSLDECIVEREQINGRAIIKKWPLGWLLYRGTVFLEAQRFNP